MSNMGTSKATAFTLIEMLVVILIIAILAGLLFPALIKAKELARRNKTKSEVRELAKAWNVYWDTYGTWPFGANVTMDDTHVGVLMGLDAGLNPKEIKFMDFPSRAQTRGLEDPWKGLYKVERREETARRQQSMNTRVHLGNRDRYIYGN